VWRPAPRLVISPPSSLRARLQRMTTRLAHLRQDRSSVVDGAASRVTAALIAACQALDTAAAARHTARLVGWGEGLTPAGDDFLVGLLAGLDAAVHADPSRLACRMAIVEALLASLPRTTRISAHQLHLAAHGHYGERLLAARDTLLSDTSWHEVDAAWHAACAIGATSGADTLAGLLGALTAWLPEPDVVAAA